MQLTIALFLILLITSTLTAPTADLYHPNDDLEILNISNFKDNVENSTTAWLVKFYDKWCGGCQRFAPKWKKFASDVAPWRDMVKVAVLECSDYMNKPICNEFEITLYPTVRYFHENYILGENLGVDLELWENDETKAAATFKKVVIDRIMAEISEGRGAIYPNLLPYNGSNPDEVFNGVSDDVEYVFLIVEPPEAYVGAEVALDLHKTPNISIRHSLNNNSALIANLQIKKFPTVVVLDRNNKSEIITEHISTRHELKTAIETFLKTKGIDVVEVSLDKKQNSTEPKPAHQPDALQQRVKKMGDVVFQTDLEAALRYSLQHEVSSVKVIKGDRLQALRAYLHVLGKYFPFGYNGTNLIPQLTYLTSSNNEVGGSEIEELVKQAEDNRVFSSPCTFLGCKGSSSKYRGYPCSLWVLFHYMTVSSVEFNGNSSDVNPREVLDAMNGYVRNFFGCRVCSEHFQQMAVERNLTSVSSLESSVLWLWEAHNVVNKRLSGDSTEDPEYPKYQFPARERCPECFTEDGSWKKTEVLKYLEKMYGKFNVRYIGSDTSVLFPGFD